MFKRIIAIGLILSMLLCLAACGKEPAPADTTGDQGEASGEPPAETDDAASAPSDGEKRLDDLIAEKNPANKHAELVAARDICTDQFYLAVANIEKTGLSGDSTLIGLIAEWSQELDNLRNYLMEYAEANEEELAALDTDADFQYCADYFLSHLSRIYNMTSAAAKDPALWLKYYTTVPESAAEIVETDGTWPAGYFFSDRVPPLEHIDGLMTSATGKEYGFEDGTEFALYVNSFEGEQMSAYVDQLIGAGCREEIRTEASNVLLWFGGMDDSEGHISVILMYNGNAGGTADDPNLMLQFYSYDIIGIMMDIGTIY